LLTLQSLAACAAARDEAPLYRRGTRGRSGREAGRGDWIHAARAAPEDAQVVAARARSAWARLIHKVYEVDPLECLKCGAAGIDCPAIYH